MIVQFIRIRKNCFQSHLSSVLPSCPRSVYAADGGPQPLIDTVEKNLSQTPREQCEREGLVRDASSRVQEGGAPGQEVVLTGLRCEGGVGQDSRGVSLE